MPIPDYSGNTFVAFTDISGFKVLMRKRDKAESALDHFYEIGYAALRDQNNNQNHRVDGFFISDSGVLFVRSNNHPLAATEALESLLRVIQTINRRMLERDYMLTSSVAYGYFSYHGRNEFNGIEKNPIYGDAYVEAFLDNEDVTQRIQPGQCRVVKRNLPDISSNYVSNPVDPILARLRDEEAQHLYFYWMVDTELQIDSFKDDFNDAYNLKYAGMLKALKRGRV